MKQVYYSQEGTPYYLKMAGKNILITTVVGTNIQPQLIFNENPTAVITNSINNVYVNTDRPVIPLMMNYVIDVNGLGTVQCSMSTPYYGQLNGGTGVGAIAWEYQKGLTKSMPNIEAISVNVATPLFNKYGLKYNQIVLSDGDFITPEAHTAFRFNTDLTNALLNVQPLFFNLAAGNWRVSQTFLYFELQKGKGV